MKTPMVEFNHKTLGSPDSMATFAALGTTEPMMAITNVPLGALTQLTVKKVVAAEKNGTSFRLGHLDRYGESIDIVCRSILAKLTGEDFMALQYCEDKKIRALASDELEAMVCSSVAKYDEYPMSDNNDIPRHIDVLRSDPDCPGIAYSVHITTDGRGIAEGSRATVRRNGRYVRTPFSTGRYRAVRGVVQRRFTTGDVHIFPRLTNATTNTDAVGSLNPSVTAHRFASRSNRVFIDAQYGKSSEWGRV